MFRKILFWSHLVTGVSIGLVVAWMSLTGVALTFQPQIETWSRAPLLSLEVPAGASRLPLEELRQRAEAARGGQATGLIVPLEPRAAVGVQFGRNAPTYVHPWTGAILEDPGAAWAARFVTLRSWHRWLGAEGDNRALGKAITGASNFAFFFLILSGLFLWFPRKWSRRAVEGVIRFRRGLRGKARDWNWHHVIGFWSLPVLLVVAGSAVVISYEWAHRLVFVMAGEEPLPPGRPGPPRVEIPPPPAGATPMALDDLAKLALRESPLAQELRFTLAPGNEGVSLAQHFSVQEAGAFPPFATLSLSLDPYDGEVLHRMSFAEQETGRRTRLWLRFLHTGEALGWPGQVVAMVASAGAVVLAWTGLALALRRFVWWRKKARSRVGAEEVAL